MAKKQTTKAAPPADIEVLDAPISEDQQLVSTDTDKLRSFMGGLGRFFTDAVALEKKAKERLDIARQLKPPTNADEDAKVQIAIRDAKLTRKEIDAHWTITQVVHGLHRKLTAARERAGLIADQAADIAQKLHNRYAEDERQRAIAETNRLRREAEERESLRRMEEERELEAKAVAAESASPELSERERTFVELVSQGALWHIAAQRAGFKDGHKAAARLGDSLKIKQALKAKEDAAAIRQQAAARRDRPLEVEFEEVKPDIARATPGGFDRSTWSAEVYDEDAFMAAVLDPRTRTALGIPADVATFRQPKLNELAKSLNENINKWPGVRAVKKTTTV